jgi:peroxiredoxin
MPFLQKMHDAHKNEGLAVIGISLDTVETEANVRPFLDANGYTYTVCIDRQSDAANLLNPKSVLPYLLIFDKEGRLNYRKDGFSTGDQPDLQKRIEELLKP